MSAKKRVATSLLHIHDLIYLFMSRHEVHSINTHTLHNADQWKPTKQSVLQGIETGAIAELQIFFPTALKSEAYGYIHILNTIVS